MITKGTEDYKKAQELASRITRTAGYQRRNDNTMFDIMFTPFYRFIENMKHVEGFASKVAETIENKTNPFGYQIASVSEKQAWILACAAVENNIEVEF